MNTTQKKISAITSLALIASFSACGSSTAQSATTDSGAKDQAKVINVGDQPAFFIFKIAEKKGLFDKEFSEDGIKVNVVSYVKQGPAIVESIASQDVDLALLGTVPTITANANGNRIIALASGNYTADGFGLFAGPNSGITDVTELKGQKIGLPFGTNEHEVTINILQAHGLQPEDVELTNLSAADALTALKKGDIAAALLKGSDFYAAQSAGATEIADNSESGPVANLIVGREDFVTANPGITSRFLKVAKEAAEYVEDNPEESIQIAAESTGASEEDGKINYESRSRLVGVEDKYLTDPLNKTLEFAKVQNLITKDVSVSDIVDTSYFEDADTQ